MTKPILKKPTGHLNEPTLPDNKKELATATLSSIALNYIERKFHLATLRCTLISHFAISQVKKKLTIKFNK